jgi:hypothetical protein
MYFRSLGRLGSVLDNVLIVRIQVPSRRHYYIALTLLAVALASSCGGAGTATSNNFKASLTLNSSSVDFGGVAVDDSKTITVTVSNASPPGSPSITVSQVSVTGTGFSATTTPVWPFTLAPGQSASLAITFSPKSSGTANGTVTISVEGSAPATVALTGDGLAPGQLAVSPTAMSFGNVTVGTSKNLTGTLSAGGADVTVSSASWNGLGYSVSGITFPVTVLAGKTKTFTVTFAPQTTGLSTGQVSFVSDATNSPTVETFSGTGTQAAQHSVTLTWDASTSQVVGYYIYRRTTSGSYGSPLNGTPQSGLTFVDNTVANGTTYFYVVTAVDSNSQESVHSNEVTAVIP